MMVQSKVTLPLIHSVVQQKLSDYLYMPGSLLGTKGARVALVEFMF